MSPFENDTREMSAQRLPKKNYSSPRLVDYGDLSVITEASNNTGVLDGGKNNKDKTG